jgi:hypothetical protein
MSQVTVQPMQWQPIVDISATEGFTANDAECFAEIRDVLKKFGLLEKYGISLIHRHFDIAEDECLVEKVDADARTLTVAPMRKAELAPGTTTTTLWKLTDDDKVAEIGCQCYVSNRGHEGRHGVY